jgi:hypothetical protein
MYAESETIVDLVRDNQSGLSFRIFEAIGMQKNVITDNNAIETYDIFETDKIKLLTNNFEKINFENSIYPENMINKYNIQNWIKTVFKI